MQGNNKPHVNKSLRKAIMKRSRLKNIYNSTKNVNDYSNYKKQRNLVLNLSKPSRRQFFENIKTDTTFNSKVFWTSRKPFFNNKYNSNEFVSLIEHDNAIQDEFSCKNI